MLLNKYGQPFEKTAVSSRSLSAVVGGRFEEWQIGEVNSYSSHYTINRGIDMLSEGISQLPLQIYRGDVLMPEDFTFPNGFSFMMPSPNMSLNELLYNTCVYFWFRGEFMVYIDENDFLTLEPVNPKKMKRNQDGTWRWNNKVNIDPSELIYAPLFNPDGDRGLSPVDVVKNEILNDINASNYSKKFFENFAQLGGTLEDTDGKITAPEMEKLVTQFNMAHAGGNKSHKVLGLPKGITYADTKSTMKEMDFLDSRKDIRDRILAVLGIHKALFGVTDQVNRSVAEEASRQLWTQVLRPKAIRIQEKFNQQLFRKYFPGYHCKFDFSVVDALKQNAESVLAQAKGYRDLGYTLNEVNEHFDLGMEEVSDEVGNTRFIPTNLVPADELLIEPEPTTTGDNKAIDSTLDKVLTMIDNTESKSVSSYKRGYNRIQRKSEKAFVGKLSKYFSKQLGIVISILKSNKSVDKDINTTMALIQNAINKDKENLTTTLLPVYQVTSLASDELAINTVGATAHAVTNADVVNNMANNIQGISSHTYRLIRTQVQQSLELGETTAQLEKRIIKIYKFNASRSRTIARTESSAVISRTTNERYIKEGVEKKRWLSAGDAIVRITHVENNSSEVVPYDYIYPNGQKFPNDGRGGAGQNINCRCTLLPIVTKE